jgi:tetratricopeptide (TPR) repeat protein
MLRAFLLCSVWLALEAHALAQGAGSMQDLVNLKSEARAAAHARASQLRRADLRHQAIEAYSDLLERWPDDARAHAALGSLLLAVGRADQAVHALERAVARAPERSAYLFDLARAYEHTGQRARALRAYTTVLQREANPAAAERYDALGGRAFGRAYPFEPGAEHGTELPAWARSAFTLSIGLGNPYAGLGGQLGYEWVPAPGALALAPYASVGVMSGALSVSPGAALGVVGSYGGHRRLLLDLGFGALGNQQFELFGHVAAERVMYGASAQIGCQWTFRGATLVRVLIGAELPTNRGVSSTPSLAFSVGVGVKP